MTFPPKSLRWMQERSAAFQKALSKKGLPMTYGAQARDKRKGKS